MSYSFEIYEKVYLENSHLEKDLTDTEKYFIVITNRLLSLITEIPLIVFQFKYIIQFLKIKYADGGFNAFRESSKRTKFIIMWIFAILFVNFINTASFNVTQIIIRIKQIENNDDELE